MSKVEHCNLLSFFPIAYGEKSMMFSLDRVSGSQFHKMGIINHQQQCNVEAGIHKRVYTHMLRASCITHLFNEGINPNSIQRHARHRDFAQTMTYNRPTQQQMKANIEKVFAKKPDLNDEDRMRVVFDKYVRGEITDTELQALLEMIRPKQLKHRGEFSGYA